MLLFKHRLARFHFIPTIFLDKCRMKSLGMNSLFYSQKFWITNHYEILLADNTLQVIQRSYFLNKPCFNLNVLLQSECPFIVNYLLLCVLTAKNYQTLKFFSNTCNFHQNHRIRLFKTEGIFFKHNRKSVTHLINVKLLNCRKTGTGTVFDFKVIISI